MRAPPAAFSAAAVRSFADAVVARDVIHHHRPGSKPRGHFLAAARIAGPNAGAQTERRVVRQPDGLLHGRHRTDCHHRPKSFLAHQLHRVIHARHDRGLQETRPQVGTAIAARKNFRAPCHRILQLLLHFFELPKADHGPDFRVLVRGRAEPQLFRFLGAHLSKPFGDGLLDVDSFHRNARLPAIHEAAPHSRARSDFEIGIGQDEHGILAAKLEHGRNQLPGASFRDALPGRHAAREENFVGAAINQRCADFPSALQHLHEPGRELRAAEKFTREPSRPGRQFGRLQQDGIAGNHCGNHLRHRNRKRIIPRRDEGDHPMRFKIEPGRFRLQR